MSLVMLAQRANIHVSTLAYSPSVVVGILAPPKVSPVYFWNFPVMVPMSSKKLMFFHFGLGHPKASFDSCDLGLVVAWLTTPRVPSLDASNLGLPLHQSWGLFHLERNTSPAFWCHVLPSGRYASGNLLLCLMPSASFSIAPYFGPWLGRRVITEAQIPLCSYTLLRLQWEALLQMDPGKCSPVVPHVSLVGSNLPSGSIQDSDSPLHDCTKKLVKSWHLLSATSRENFFLMLPFVQFLHYFQ